MISITVKTLDSQNHEFVVDDDVTVRQFKDSIAERTSIAAESQRLIYCGRVLSDEKLLREYDVNGKVVHLVQRAPPSQRGNANPSNLEPSSAVPNINIRAPLNYRTIDGVVLGAVSIPMNANNGNTQTVTPSLNPSSTLCMNRITVARYMLECANNIAAYLEDPSQGLNNAAMDLLAQQTMESTVLEVGISAVTDIEIPQYQMQDIVQAFQGAFSAAFRQNGINNFRVMPQPGDSNSTSNVQIISGEDVPQRLASLINNAVESRGNAINPFEGGSSSSSSNSSAVTVEGESPPTLTASHNMTTASLNSNNNTSTTTTTTSTGSSEENPPSSSSGPPRQQTTSTQTLAEVVQQMRNLQVRLEPFIQQYYEILLNDPPFDESNTADRESSQRVFDRVSEALHYMAHAQHAISDLMLDLSTNAPRHLCCRPILVEQSAYVSSGLALPNPVLAVRRPNGNNNDTSMINNNIPNNNNNNNNNVPILQPEGVPVPAASTNTESGTTPRPNLRIGITQPNVISVSRGGTPPSFQVARLIQAVMESAPLHADVHVEINGPNMTSAQSTSTTNTTSTTTTDSGAVNDEANQPRVTTATHPTTSTQTRSTARPHVQLTNIPPPVRNFRPVPANMFSAFDRFLPCNSHHIRETAQNDNQQSNTNLTSNNRPSGRLIGRSSLFRSPRAQSENRAVLNQRTDTSSSENLSTEQSELVNQISGFHRMPNIPIRILGNQITIRDLILSPPRILTHIRNSILTNIQTNLFNGTEITDENLENGINEGINLLDSFLQPLSQLDLPDYDTRRSVENLLRNYLSGVFVLLRDDQSPEFGIRLVRDTKVFVKRFFTILYTCTGSNNSTYYTNTLMNLLLSTNMVFEQERSEVMNLIKKQLEVSEMDITDIRQFIVIRRPAPGENIEYLATSNSQSQPMETDETENTTTTVTPDTSSTLPVVTPTAESVPVPSVNIENEEVVLSVLNREQMIRPPTIEDDESLPSVVIGSEPWHCNFPTSSWIPVITRDIGKQRRQNSQPPFSDAYISGMSSKRRKIISESKPSMDVTNMLSDGVRNAIATSGISSTSTMPLVDEISSTIASDPAVQNSYKEALKANARERIKNDPDFSSEKFPNSSKYFNNQK